MQQERNMQLLSRQQALKQSGVTEDLKFDHYEKNLNWYD